MADDSTSSSQHSSLLARLVQSLSKTQPILSEESSLIDKFVLSHQSVYQLQPAAQYKQVLVKLVENRLLNPEWWWKGTP